jgi:hypothetical protein
MTATNTLCVPSRFPSAPQMKFPTSPATSIFQTEQEANRNTTGTRALVDGSVRRRLSLGLICGPPWTVQLPHIRDETDPQGRRRGPQVPHGAIARWNAVS